MLACGSTAPDVEVADQRWLMGFASGWMYVGVGIVGLIGAAVPALRFHPAWQIGLSAVSMRAVIPGSAETHSTRLAFRRGECALG